MRQILVLSAADLLALRQGQALDLAIGDQAVTLMIEGAAPRAHNSELISARANGNHAKAPEPERQPRQRYTDAQRRAIIAAVDEGKAKGEPVGVTLAKLGGVSASLIRGWRIKLEERAAARRRKG